MASSTMSTLEMLRASASNATSYLNPSGKDLLLLVPRIVTSASNFAVNSIPDIFENIFGERGGRLIAEATGEEARNVAASTARLAQEATSIATQAAMNQADGQAASSLGSAFSFAHARTFGGIFTYLTSKWAIGCFTVAVVLNRTHIYASARHHLALKWQLRLAVRLIPILLFALQCQNLVRALRCQTSPTYPAMRYGDPDKHLSRDFAADGGLLHQLTSALMFWESEADSCLAVSMIPSKQEPDDLRGSLSFLWPVFESVCLGQFVETLSCAVQGRPVMAETGMSIFEHSLAFAEAEAMVTSQFTFSPLGILKSNGTHTATATRELPHSTTLVTKSFLLRRLNTPPEVLLMALISCLNNLSSHVLGVLGWQSRFRLLNTGVCGICFMASFLWGILHLSFDQGLDAGLLRYPTVCVVGFIPHILILLGITTCGIIYGLALILSILSPPPDLPRLASWRQRFWLAQENMQANIQLSSLRINTHEDFYTALLRIGFSALTAASEAVFLNEGRRINVGQWTWLEEERLNEIEQSRAAESFQAALHAQIMDDGATAGAAAGVASTEDGQQNSLFGSGWKSGYARERSTKALKSGSHAGGARFRADGVGVLQRGGRYILAYGFLTNIFWLLTGWLALFLIKALGAVGITHRPAWLMRAFMASKGSKSMEGSPTISSPETLEFWILTDDGDLVLPTDNDVDVEAETKKRLQLSSSKWSQEQEEQLDTNLYTWFTSGGWWGERDTSGIYQPPASTDDDDDLTSVISATDAASIATNDWESDVDAALSSGQNTPTQVSHPRRRASTPPFDTALDPLDLARLLNPQNSDQRAETRILAHHLSSPQIVTRSHYKSSQVSSATRVLTSTRYRPPGVLSASSDRKLSPLEEAQVLEYLILKRRAQRSASGTGPAPSSSSTLASSSTSTSAAAAAAAAASANQAASSSSWLNGADGLGAGGPQCVVCQSAPRTVLAWPCRCLSLCEDCRVSLAMNNFATCVCCRQEVVGFSRLFVP